MKAKQIAAIVVAVIVAGACTKSDNITKVEPPPDDHAPVAKIDGPAASVEGSEMSFSAKSSTDPDGDPVRYQWTFGDGGVDSGDVVKHTYADNGSETVRLVVRDTQGLADTAALTIAVANAPPQIASITAPTSAVALPDSVKIDVAVSDPGKADSLTVSFDWGDGKKNTVPKAHGAHKYGTVGHYTVQVTVTDDDGASASKTAAIDVSAAPQLVDGYEVIDLGTLGGNNAIPMAMNDAAQVVGCSRTAAGKLHAFVWSNGVMRDLSPDADSSCATIITNDGVIGGITDGRFTLWRNGTPTDLGSAAGDDYSPFARIVGFMPNGDALMSYEDYGHGSHSWIWHNGARQDLGGLEGSPYSSAEAVNSKGQIVGYSAVSSYVGDHIPHAFMWENGTMRDLGVLAPRQCPDDPPRSCAAAQAVDVNESGEVIGSSADSAGSWGTRGVRWANGQIHRLGFDSAVAINNTGEIVSHDGHYRRGEVGIVDLGSLGGGGTWVIDINDASTITGSSLNAQNRRHVFVWAPGRAHLVDLGAGPRGTGGDQAVAVALNARGDILGKNLNNCSDTFGPPWYCTSTTEPYRAVLWRAK